MKSSLARQGASAATVIPARKQMRLGGPTTKRQPSLEGLDIDSSQSPSAGGAELQISRGDR